MKAIQWLCRLLPAERKKQHGKNYEALCLKRQVSNEGQHYWLEWYTSLKSPLCLICAPPFESMFLHKDIKSEVK